MNVNDYQRLLAAVKRYGSFRIDYKPETTFLRLQNRLPHATISFGTELCVFAVATNLDETMRDALDSLDRLEEINRDR